LSRPPPACSRMRCKRPCGWVYPRALFGQRGSAHCSTMRDRYRSIGCVPLQLPPGRPVPPS
jgi:hypothetical protein